MRFFRSCVIPSIAGGQRLSSRAKQNNLPALGIAGGAGIPASGQGQACRSSIIDRLEACPTIHIAE